MIQERSILKSADNSGARRIQCIRVLGGYKKRYARVGDIITVTVKEAVPYSVVKKGQVYHAVVVRTRNPIKRKNGITLSFGENAVVIIDKESKEPKGTRVFGPIARELRKAGFPKIISLAPEVL